MRRSQRFLAIEEEGKGPMFPGFWGSDVSDLSHNEGVKLTATLFNNLATFCLVSAFVAPMFNINVPVVSSPWLFALLSLAVGVGFWFVGQFILAKWWEG
jgi:hypothetical protein